MEGPAELILSAPAGVAAAAPEPSPFRQADLTVVIVSFNDRHWLDACLRSLEDHAGPVVVDVVVVDNGTDGAHEFVREHFPDVRTMQTDNRGFSHANNTALIEGVGRYALILNPDTELIDGSLAEMIEALDARPEVGVAGVRQVTADGVLWPTIRRFPSFGRALGDALGLERWARRPSWAGERELDLRLYEQEVECDWTSGSYMLIRREALLAAGLFDERFFLYSEEPDLCIRVKTAGWGVRHLPVMTILHHAGKGGARPKMAAQEAYARRQYARKHLQAPHKQAYLAAIALGYLLRVLRADSTGPSREAARLALRTLLGAAPPPFGRPMEVALSRTAGRT
jgi:GT2 family glycosyltransferase